MASLITPDAAWLRLLSDSGVSILFAAFTILVILPAMGYATWRSMRWAAQLVERFVTWSKEMVDWHRLTVNRLEESSRVLSESQTAMHRDIGSVKMMISDIHTSVMYSGCAGPVNRPRPSRPKQIEGGNP